VIIKKTKAIKKVKPAPVSGSVSTTTNNGKANTITNDITTNMSKKCRPVKKATPNVANTSSNSTKEKSTAAVSANDSAQKDSRTSLSKGKKPIVEPKKAKP
jgi:hypothetical protein